ncbi:aspartate/glutamate racemase family protein [Desulfosediminicola flagellatus]|uniref:aspartate/glutamate racemase family protein n=1 Tax=Desulfosediminicola flagellatus TaxID=2569541 RepID=UPI0010AD7D65|nr:aspartate/glutamate racemase family protein [Desulfosediminicola flagellatus]
MKTIGLLGGMSWESTSLYYQLINSGINRRLSGLHSAKIAMVSVNFYELEQLMAQGNWDRIAEILVASCLKIEAAGADVLLICTNTMHKVAEQIQAAISIPILHLADATAQKIRSDNKKTIGLLGTRITMEEDFYRGRLTRHGIEVVLPEDSDMDIIHNVIFDELCKGKCIENSRNEYLRIINDLHTRGAEGIVLGCTEIGILIKPQDTEITLYDTTLIHAEAAVEFALR